MAAGPVQTRSIPPSSQDADPVLRAELVKKALAVRGEIVANQRKQADERWEAYLATAQAPHHTRRRRNRPDKMIDRTLCRMGAWGVATAIARSGMWSKDLRPGLAASDREAGLLQYCAHPSDAGAQPRALFDQEFYLSNSPGCSGLPPLAHYLIYGDQAGLSPHPLISVPWYRANNADALGATGLTVLEHFVAFGAPRGLDPHPLFDTRHYIGQLPHGNTSGLNPLVHYLRIGWREGRDPHPLFANDWYLQRYLAAARIMAPPLAHYVREGARMGFDPHPLFSSRWYEEAHSGRLPGGATPLEHFHLYGLGERADPSPNFSTEYYLRQEPVLHRTGENPLTHYMRAGAWAGLSPHSTFDAVAWLSDNPDALDSNITPFQAWLGCPSPDQKPTL